MKPNLKPTLVLAALLFALAGCHRSAEPQVVDNGQPIGQGMTVQVGNTKDPSLPDASAAIAALDAEEKAKEAALLQPAVPPAKEDTAAAPSQDAKPLESQAAIDTGTVRPEATKVN